MRFVLDSFRSDLESLILWGNIKFLLNALRRFFSIVSSVSKSD